MTLAINRYRKASFHGLDHTGRDSQKRVASKTIDFLLYGPFMRAEAHSSSMSNSAKAANRIKQEAGFPSSFPDEIFILAVFNFEELYNSKSKHNSN